MIIAVVSLLSVLTYMHTSSADKLFLNLHINLTRDYGLMAVFYIVLWNNPIIGHPFL